MNDKSAITAFVAIDYHKSYSYGTIVNAQGELLRRGRLQNTPEALHEFLGEHAARPVQVREHGVEQARPLHHPGLEDFPVRRRH